MNHLSRRQLLKSSAALGAFSILPASFARGQSSPSATGVGPNDRVNVACVGISQKGYGNTNNMANTGLANIVALCDVHLGQPKAQENIAKFPEAKTYTDFRVMFDEMADDIDAVIVSTPDHSHFAIAAQAMALGKHVYVEKPLAHTFGQCQRLIDLADRTGVVTQMGNQGHSSGNLTQFQAWVDAGVIQDVSRISAFMNKKRRWHGWGTSTTGYFDQPLPDGMNWEAWVASADMHPFSDKLHPGNWRSWYEYGSGCFGDWGPHILDTAHRCLELGLPTKVAAVHRDGPNDWVYPQATTIRFDFPARQAMPACTITWYDGQTNFPPVEPELGNWRRNQETKEIERAPLEITDKTPGKIIYGKDLTFFGGSHGSTLRVVEGNEDPDFRKSLPPFNSKVSNHYQNFLLACQGEEEARSPFAISGPLSQVFNIGILAQRFGAELEFDPTSRQITNHAEANALLDPEPRRGWEAYYAL
ncbi:MAG: Gfo/Idh/MocA family oxidoreductase [Planctomycetota bacterium]